MSGSVRNLIPRIEVKISDSEPSIEVKDAEETIKGFFDRCSTV